MHWERPGGKHAKLSTALWVVGNRIILFLSQLFFISIVSQFSIANRRSFYNAKNKLYMKGFEWKLFGAVCCPLFVLRGLEERIIWPGVRSHGVLLRLC